MSTYGRIGFIILLLATLSMILLSGCERSNDSKDQETSDHSHEAHSNLQQTITDESMDTHLVPEPSDPDKANLAIPDTGSVVSTVPATDPLLDLELGLSACDVRSMLHPEAEPKLLIPAWRNLEEYPALEGVTDVIVDRVFDAAGYGWKPGISYALTKDGTAWYWGYDQQEYIPFPRKIDGLQDVVQITGSYALTSDGQVWRLDAEKVPSRVDGLSTFANIQQLGEMVGLPIFLIREDATLWKLELEGDELSRILPDLEHVREIHGSSFSLFIVDGNGDLHYMDGRYGNSKFDQAENLEFPGKVAQIAVGYNDHALVLSDQGELYKFAPDEQKWQQMPVVDKVIQMAVAGDDTYFIVQSDGTVWGWGENRNQMLGVNLRDYVEEPQHIKGIDGIVDIAAGTDHILALDRHGFVYSWGSNMTGQLGRIPLVFDHWTEYSELDEIREVIAQPDRPYFIKEDGTLWSLHEERRPYLINGAENIQSLTFVYNTPLTLNTSGQIQLWSTQLQSCQIIDLPFAVKHIVGGEDHLLLQSEDDHFFMIKMNRPLLEGGSGYDLSRIVPEKIEWVAAEGDWMKQIDSLYSNHYTFFALTEDGDVYWMEKMRRANTTHFNKCLGSVTFESWPPSSSYDTHWILLRLGRWMIKGKYTRSLLLST